jgi:hypothetical protein
MSQRNTATGADRPRLWSRRRVVPLLGLGMAAGATTLGLAVARSGNPIDAAGPTDVEEVGIGHPAYEFDPTDDRALAAFATDIFLGRVEAQTGNVGAPTSAPGQELPMTQFSVKVLRVVKGDTWGTVTVNQVGGQDDDVLVTRANGKRERVTRRFVLDGDALLVPGQTALFMTVNVPESGWYQLVVAGESHPRARDRGEQDALVERFRRAARQGP